MTQFPSDNTPRAATPKERACRTASRAESRRAFTVVELLIVIAVIILLLSILIVGVNRAVRAAQSANTRSLMGSMKQALVQFKEDHGYIPPVLNDDRGLEFDHSNGGYASFNGPNPNDAEYADDAQQWYSITSMAEYLIGWDHGVHDGYGESPSGAYPGELPRTGIRTPGGDGAWGATIYGSRSGALADRNPPVPPNAGRRFGPYLELTDERLLGGIDPNGNIVFAGEDSDFDTYAKTIVDYWGSPIRYYRPAYPPGALTSSYPKIEQTNADGHTVPVPTLSDLYALRPYETEQGNVINGFNDQQTGGTIGGSGDPTSVRQLLSAEFALMSPGPDKSMDPLRRIDDDEFNRDNIVELGP